MPISNPIISPERLPFFVADMRSLDGLAPDEREQRLDILSIKWGAEVRAIMREQAITASPNVIRLADARTKLPTEPA